MGDIVLFSFLLTLVERVLKSFFCILDDFEGESLFGESELEDPTFLFLLLFRVTVICDYLKSFTCNGKRFESCR